MHLKKYCNLYEQIDLFKQTSTLHEKTSMLINNIKSGKFRIKSIIEEGISEQEIQDQNKKLKNRQVDILNKVGEYFSPKITINQNQKGRCIMATSNISKGELIMVCQSLCSAKAEKGEFYHQEVS